MKKITLLFLFLIGSITSSFGQLSQDFEGTWPPADWTIVSTNATNTWEEEATFGINGKSAYVGYDFGQDESLISPVFTVPTGAPNLEFTVAMSYYWAVDPNNNYDFIVSISTDGGGTWTPIWSENDLGVFVSFDNIDVSIPLAAYSGQANTKLKFQYVGDDGADLLLDDISVALPPSTAPDCVTLTAPADAATAIDYSSAVNLTWTAAATGSPAVSYDVYLDTNATPTTLLGNQTTLTRAVTGLLPSTTYYWMVIAKNVAGDATGCSVFSFTTSANLFAPYCGPMTFTSNVEPITLVNFAGINNSSSALVGPNNGTTIIAHENYTAITGNVTAGSSYPITLKGNTDGNFTTYLRVYADWNQNNDFTDAGESYDIGTIANSTGTDAVQLDGSILVPPTALVGSTRMRVIKRYAGYGTSCQTGIGFGQAEDYTLNVAAVPADSPDFVNLQYPATLNFTQGGSGVVYGRVYEAGLTDTTSGQAPGILAWVGISPIGDNSNPNTWTTWVPATFNVETGNDDEYQASIGSTLAPGTYYYATRFTLNSGAYVYGGTDGTFGNFWNGTTYNSGVLTVTAPVAPANDECSGAIALTAGGVYADQVTNGTNLAATTSSQAAPTTCFGFAGGDVWFSVVVPASGSITIETGDSTAGGTGVDTVITIYSGADCSSLTQVDCDDDSAATGAYSLKSLTGLTPGSTLYIRAYEYNNDNAGGFGISAYDASLANSSFDNANFAYYPNPVKNVLNLSYNKEISNVEVFNLLGQRVSSNRINSNTAEVDMSNLSKGAYMVKVTSDNQVKTIKVIKE